VVIPSSPSAYERLKWLCSPDAERLSDHECINRFVAAGLEVRTSSGSGSSLDS
jgi:hypothetical protein